MPSSGGISQGRRAGSPRPITSSAIDASTEALHVSIQEFLGSAVVEADLDKENDEVAVFGGIDGSETASTAVRQIINVSSTGKVRTEAEATGNVAHDGVDSGNPVKIGAKAVAHSASPTAVAAADRTDLLANRHGVQFTIGGHPNLITAEYNTTAAQANDPMIDAIGAGTKIVVTSITVTLDEATTVGVDIRIGFGTASVPAEGASGAAATSGVLLSHPGIVPGGGLTVGDGSGILGIGADGEELRITNSVPTTGKLVVNIRYFTIDS